MRVDDIHQRNGSLVADRYRLLRIIGEGGMGAVFEAEDLVAGGLQVAVKLIKPEFITLPPNLNGWLVSIASMM